MSVTDALDIDPSPPHPLIPCSHPLCRCGVRKMTVTDSFLHAPPLPPPLPPVQVRSAQVDGDGLVPPQPERTHHPHAQVLQAVTAVVTAGVSCRCAISRQ